MVGGDQRGSTLVKPQFFEAKNRVEVDVIEMEDRQDARICSRAPQMLPDIRLLQMLFHRPRHCTRKPFIKVTEDDTRAVKLMMIDDACVEQAACLAAMFEECRPQMNIKDVKSGA